MMATVYPFRYDKQFEKYIGQFMRVFSGFQVQDGVVRDGDKYSEPVLQRVPVVYGTMSRVVATHLQQNALSSTRLPMLAVNLANLQMDVERKRSHLHTDVIQAKNEFSETRGIERLIGPSFMMNMEVSIYASSTSEMFSILEQILLIFNPRVTIQTDTDVFNSDYLTEISLETVDNEIQYPMGPGHRVVMMSLMFLVPIRLRYPMGMNGAMMDEIYLSIYELTQEAVKATEDIDTLIIDKTGVEKAP